MWEFILKNFRKLKRTKKIARINKTQPYIILPPFIKQQPNQFPSKMSIDKDCLNLYHLSKNSPLSVITELLPHFTKISNEISNLIL